MKIMTNCKYYILSVIMLVLVSQSVQAQWDFDVLTVEAMISDHKQGKSLLLARSTIEQANQILHENCAAANVHYKDINVELDKYTRCFDLIDMIYSSGKTVINVRNTYNDVKEKLKAFERLNNRYIDKCLSHGNILSSDSLIINTYARMLLSISTDAEHLYESLSDLIVYTAGASECTTADLMLILDGINDCFDHIRYTLDCSYHYLWKYITIRTTYWKNALYRAKSIKEICTGAIQRWVNSRYEAIERPMH